MPIFIKYDDYPAQIPQQRYRNRIKLSGEVSLKVSSHLIHVVVCKNLLEMPIFIKYDGYPAQIPQQRYRNRIKLSGEVSLKVSSHLIHVVVCKNLLEMPIFIKYDGYPAQIPQQRYRNRIKLSGEVSLKVSSHLIHVVVCKNLLEMPIFIKYDGYPAQIPQQRYRNRIKLSGEVSLKVSSHLIHVVVCKNLLEMPIFIKYDDYPAQIPQQRYRNRIKLSGEVSLKVSSHLIHVVVCKNLLEMPIFIKYDGYPAQIPQQRYRNRIKLSGEVSLKVSSHLIHVVVCKNLLEMPIFIKYDGYPAQIPQQRYRNRIKLSGEVSLKVSSHLIHVVVCKNLLEVPIFIKYDGYPAQIPQQRYRNRIKLSGEVSLKVSSHLIHVVVCKNLLEMPIFIKYDGYPAQIPQQRYRNRIKLSGEVSLKVSSHLIHVVVCKNLLEMPIFIKYDGYPAQIPQQRYRNRIKLSGEVSLKVSSHLIHVVVCKNLLEMPIFIKYDGYPAQIPQQRYRNRIKLSGEVSLKVSSHLIHVVVCKNLLEVPIFIKYDGYPAQIPQQRYRNRIKLSGEVSLKVSSHLIHVLVCKNLLEMPIFIKYDGYPAQIPQQRYRNRIKLSGEVSLKVSSHLIHVVVCKNLLEVPIFIKYDGYPAQIPQQRYRNRIKLSGEVSLKVSSHLIHVVVCKNLLEVPIFIKYDGYPAQIPQQRYQNRIKLSGEVSLKVSSHLIHVVVCKNLLEMPIFIKYDGYPAQIPQQRYRNHIKLSGEVSLKVSSHLIHVLVCKNLLEVPIFIKYDGYPTQIPQQRYRNRIKLSGEVSLKVSSHLIHVVVCKNLLEMPIFIKYVGYPAQIPQQRYRNRIKLSGEVSLKVTNIQAEDEGWYECNIIFIDGAEETTVNGSWIYLTVHSRPYIISSSNALLQHRRGETARMFCKGKGSPTPTLMWFKEGRPLHNTFRQTVDGTHVTIKNLRRSDGGTYMCTFENSVGEISQLIRLVVEGGPLIMNSPQNITTMKGELVTIVCNALAYPSNITYHWFKKGLDVRKLKGFEVGRILIQSDGSLRITTVIKDDMAWYMCRPSNGYGEDEASAFLNVTYKPTVVDMPSTLTWARGLTGRIECHVDANPPVTSTLWIKDSRNLANTSRIEVLGNGTLFLSDVRESDSGSYSCIPTSRIGTGEASPSVQVVVRDPPIFKYHPNSSYERQVGESVLMPCFAEGNPQPQILWEHNGVLLKESSRIHIIGGNLSISDLSKEDHGKYECIANNKVAAIVAPTALRIMGTSPHAPNNITVIPGLFSAKVSWEPAYDGGTAQNYLLWFRVVDSKDNNWNTIGVPVGHTTFTLYALMADTTYEFMVQSRNSVGDSLRSNRVQAKTLGNHSGALHSTLWHPGYHSDLVTALPTDSSGSTYIPPIIVPRGPRPSPPRNVTAEIVSDGILVSWLPPLFTEVPIFYYTIDYRSDGLWTRYKGRVMVSTGLSLVLEGMNPGTTYELRVLANGVLAYSKPSNIVTVTTAAKNSASSNSGTTESLALPDALIGGIIGGLLFLLVAILLAVIAVIHSRRKEQKNKAESRYNDVNYSKPEESENRPQAPPKWDRWQQPGGGDSMRRDEGGHQGVYILPRTDDVDPGYTMRSSSSILRDRRLYDRDHPMYDPAAGYRVARQEDEDPNLVADLSLSRLSGNYPRSPRDFPDHQSRFPDHPNRFSDSSWPPGSTSPTAASRSYPSDYNPAPPSSARPGAYPTETSPPPQNPSRHSRWSDPRDEDPRQQNPSLSYEGPYHSFEDEDDENGFLPPTPHHHHQNVPSSRPAFPRHSSMKPAHQTYLTGEPVPPYAIDDISSVLQSPFSDPSREDRSPPSHYPSSASLPSQPAYLPSQPAYLPSQPSYLPSEINRPRDSTHEPFRPYEQPRVYDRNVRGSDRDYLPNIPEDSQDTSGATPDGRGAWGSPVRSPGDENNSSTGSSGGRPIGYTRDHLQGVVDRVRQGPRGRADDTLDDGGFLDASGLRQQSPSDDRVFRFPDPKPARPGGENRQVPYYTSDVAPFKPPRLGQYGPNVPDRRPPSRSRDDTGPDTVSHSSGIGSRNTSNSNSSFPNRLGKNSMSYSSLLTPQEQDLSQDSSPFLDGSANNRRDTSGDENYEFDSLGALESDILDALRNYSRLSDNGQVSASDLYSNLYPKSRKPSRYSDSDQRFNKLREEFKQYRQRQVEITRESAGQSSEPMYPMDSEML
ncbi:uncharacterized protein LOC121386106 [Gigantopelta aegis]|uniref:uncharacterized protein LOC121386106 n=1 Tax=Gigantopelta aegis TaxID=1735272 RepID=UPI001B8873DF|nr:uncharacterized protein LOC121386106 [Gigantopelta aegis]